MSKAFTKEDDAGPTEELGRLPPRLAPGQQRYVTAEGLAALKAELAALPQDSRRAQLLLATIAVVTVADPPEDGRALFGSRVQLEDEEGGTRDYRIVGPDEADARAGLISVESPLARALLGRREGDTVEVQLPRGTAEYTLLRARGG
jgi:transcription elongation factor GreB